MFSGLLLGVVPTSPAAYRTPWPVWQISVIYALLEFPLQHSAIARPSLSVLSQYGGKESLLVSLESVLARPAPLSRLPLQLVDRCLA